MSQTWTLSSRGPQPDSAAHELHIILMPMDRRSGHHEHRREGGITARKGMGAKKASVREASTEPGFYG